MRYASVLGARCAICLGLLMMLGLASCGREDVVAPSGVPGQGSVRSMTIPEDGTTSNSGPASTVASGTGTASTGESGGISDDGNGDGDSERNKKTRSH